MHSLKTKRTGKLENENICTIIFPVTFPDKVGYLRLSVNNSKYLCAYAVQVGILLKMLKFSLNVGIRKYIIFKYHGRFAAGFFLFIFL